MSAETARRATPAELSSILCREEEAAEFGAPGLEGASYSVEPGLEEASVTRIDLNGRLGRRRAGGSRIFYVLGGEGNFEVDGNSLDAAVGDAVHVRPGQVYDFQGELTLLGVCAPAFDLSKEEKATG
jgi:mannose-6-phosphate isomerase class I